MVPDRQASDAPNVVLTGFMGTGKSTVGALLAGRLGLELVDTDVLIEELHGPIPAIFAEHGEGGFRRIEREVVWELAARRGLVVSTGGRMLLDQENARALGRSGRVFCLTASVDTIVERVAPGGDAPGRPLLAGGDPRERVRALLAERSPGYAAYEQIDTNARSPEDVAEEIAERLRSR